MSKLRPMPMFCALATMAMLLALLLYGALPWIPARFFGGPSLFRSPLFIVLAAVLGVGLLWVSATRPFSGRQLPFWICHLGCIVIGGGAIASHFLSEKHMIVMPLGYEVAPSTVFQSAEGMMGEPVQMPFPMSIGGFRVEIFDPEIYFLYKFKPPAKDGEEGSYEQVATVPVRADKMLDLSKVPGIPKDLAAEPIQAGLATDAGNRWSSHIPLGEYLLVWDRPADKSVSAELNIGAGEKPETVVPFQLNAPAEYRGWRFYLMGYDQQRLSWATLSARRDPGRDWVLAGCWLVIAGVALMCFRRSPMPSAPAPASEGGAR